MPEYYPPVGFHFRVEFDLEGAGGESSDARFSEVSGLTATIETEPLIEGGENRFTHQLPKGTKYGALSLKRGMLTDSKVIDWFKDSLENFKFSPTEIRVILLNEQHEPLASWEVMNARPSEWSLDPLGADKNQVLVESMKLTYDFFRRTK